MQVLQEMRRLDLSRVPKFADEKERPEETVGLVLDFEQMWYYQSLPQARRWNQNRWLQIWYGALSKLGARIQILRPGVDWPNNLPLIIAPGLQMVDEKLVARLDSYARSGGNLVLTCRTGLMDRTGQLCEGPWAKPILPLIGGTIEGYDSLRDDRFGQITFEGKKYPWGAWGDQITPNRGTEVIATYADQFYAGAAAVTRSRLEKGTVNYFGVFSEQALVDAFVESLAKSIGPEKLRGQTLPDRVQLLRRGPYRIALNYRDEIVNAPAPASAKFLVGERKIGPADVAIWEE
jgi:beta-galactosidase